MMAQMAKALSMRRKGMGGKNKPKKKADSDDDDDAKDDVLKVEPPPRVGRMASVADYLGDKEENEDSGPGDDDANDSEDWD